jgi:hypothetical protein
LLEHATDEQRTVLVTTAAPNLVEIALNQHGTRALQKMIEYLSTPEQVNSDAADYRYRQLTTPTDSNNCSCARE